MLKKYLALLLSVIIALTCFSGCYDGSAQAIANTSDAMNDESGITSSHPVYYALEDISLGQGVLEPAFSLGIYEYSIILPNECSSLDISPVTSNDSYSVEIKAPDEISVGENEAIIIVSNDDDKLIYNLNVIRCGEDEAGLLSLSVDGFELTPAFSYYESEYTMDVKANTESVDINAVPLSENSTVEISGGDDIVKGDNPVSITITSPDKTVKKVINLNIYKSSDIYVEGLDEKYIDLIEKGEKFAAITFDDGPGKYTDKLLDILDKYGVKATFYIIGQCVEKYPEAVKRIARSGHALGNHSWDHANLSKMSDEDKSKNLNKASDAIYEACGNRPTTIRPPGGNWNKDVKSFDGLPVVYWSIDPMDWKYRNAQSVANHILDNVDDTSIILLHDIYETSITAADIVICRLASEKYNFVTVDDMLLIKKYKKLLLESES